jgi:hypothetical protein
MSEPSTGILGRISGKLLSPNLIRNGYDLTFSNTGGPDDNVLFLQVSDLLVGVNTDSPSFQLDVNGTSLVLDIFNQQATIGNIVFQSSATITTTVGEINIRPGGIDPTAIFDRLQAGNIQIDGNVIENFSIDQNLIFDPNGTGTIELQADTNITANLHTTGTISLDGDLSTIENITIGNNINQDTLTIFPNLQDNILPSIDLNFDIGDGVSRWRDLYTEDFFLSTSLTVANVNFTVPATISSSTGLLNFNLSGIDPVMIFNTGLSTPDFKILGNKILTKNNSDLILDPSGAGSVKFNNPSNFAEDLDVNGWVGMTGNLNTTSNITIGDNPNDIVIINTELDQDINPGSDLAFDLGKSDKRWRNAYIADYTNIGTIRSQTTFVNNALLLGGLNNIQPLTTNTDLIINPETTISRIENIGFGPNTITNLDNSPLRLISTGIGYYVISGDNGFVIPFGTTAERPLPSVSPRAMTRWNTELEQLECFDSITETWRRAIGSTDVNIEEMEDYSYFYTLILG